MQNNNYHCSGILLILCTLSLNTIFAQNLHHIGVNDGLPSSNVYTVFEDSLGFMWFATDNGIVKYDGYEFRNFDLNAVGASNDVWEIYDDKDGRIWLSSEKKLVYIQNDTLHTISFPDSLKYSHIKYHHIDKKGNHIVYLDNHVFKIIKPKNGQPRLEKAKFDNKQIGQSYIFIKEDEQGNEWYFIRRVAGIFLYNTKNGTLQPTTNFIELEDGKNKHYSYGYSERMADDKYIVFTEIGIYAINFEEEKFEYLDILPEGTKISYVTTQTENISKLSTNKGILYLDKNLRILNEIQLDKDINVNVAYEDSKGNIWFCTFGKGVYFLNKSHRDILTISKDIKENDLYNIFDLASDKHGNIWFTNNTKSIWKINDNNEAVPYDLSHHIKKEGDIIRYLEFDKNGNLYLSSNQFIFLIIPYPLVDKGNFNVPIEGPNNTDYAYTTVFKEHRIYSLYHRYVKHISKTKDGDIIVGGPSKSTLTKIIDEKSVRTETFLANRNYSGAVWNDNLVIGKNHKLLFSPLKESAPTFDLKIDLPIESVLNDQENFLWIVAKNGSLFRYDGHHLDSIDDIRELKLRVFNILETDRQFWLSTSKGVARIDIIQQKPLIYDFKLFYGEHGLINSQIYETAIKDKHLYLSTQKGVNIIPINQLNPKEEKQNIFFTNLTLNDKDTLIHFDEYTDKYLPLKHDINSIKIKFSCLPYANHKNVYYEYRVDGLRNEWHRLQSNVKEFDINTLRPDKYTFEIRALDVNGIISNTIVFKFQTLAPWWNTWWAYLVYFLVFAGSTYFFVQQSISRKKIQHEYQTLAEFDKAKTNFFTNITHELRTPLTIISSLVQLEKNNKEQFNHNEFFEDLDTHTHTMLYLINQLLDISKLEAGAMPIYYDTEDIVQFCKRTSSIFVKTAAIKHQKLHFYTNTDNFLLSFDREKLERILYNLLSNAIKFTQQRGVIEIFLRINPEHGTLAIEVKDNGPGIDEQSLANIFNKYISNSKTQINSTGIGLYLTKELTKLLGGDIQLKSSSEGSSFTVQLPFSEVHLESGIIQPLFEIPLVPNPKEEFTKSTILKAPQQEYIPQLLLIDDNPNLLNLLQKLLVGKYEVLLARNAQVGLNLATENVPELIISDIMMPGMDGFELCRHLKNNVKTSHIPIILLSAKNAQRAKLKGKALGANAYLTKPFNHTKLLETIENLITQRSELRDKYTNLDTLVIDQKSNKEDQFIAQIKTLIEENISDMDLDVNFLCTSLYMSRTQLHNKLKYNTGLSTRKFIRKIRLEKAKQLIEQLDLKIGSVAHEVGMHPKYFSSMFLEAYGESPSQYRKTIIKQKQTF